MILAQSSRTGLETDLAPGQRRQEDIILALPIIWSFVNSLLLGPQSGILFTSLQGQVITEALLQWFEKDKEQNILSSLSIRVSLVK